MRRYLLLTPLLLLVACDLSGANGKNQLALDSSIGVAVERSGIVCLAVHRANIAAGTPLTIVLLSPPQSTLKAEVVRRAAEGCPSFNKSDPLLHRYELRLRDKSLPPSTPAIAVLSFPGPFQVRGDYVTADITGDGEPEYFRFCTSREGVHLTLWSGEALRGTRRWHQYYYLGYDVEPDCTPAETDLTRP